MGSGGDHIAVFCLAVGPRENLGQRISVGSRGEEGGGQHLGPIDKKAKVDLGPEKSQGDGALFAWQLLKRSSFPLAGSHLPSL